MQGEEDAFHDSAPPGGGERVSGRHKAEAAGLDQPFYGTAIEAALERHGDIAQRQHEDMVIEGMSGHMAGGDYFLMFEDVTAAPAAYHQRGFRHIERALIVEAGKDA